MAACFNENDPKKAAWLRELIRRGHIAKGEVDERSIEDIAPEDLRRFRSVHLFAGVGIWSHALRLAGWPDDRPVWTCSCPCQPFSSAGRGDGLRDERHLWPAAFHLIRECRPRVLFGEQVSSPDGLAWLDLVYADLESLDYTVGAIIAPAASVGSPHGRHRINFVAYAGYGVRRRSGEQESRGNEAAERNEAATHAERCGSTCNVDDTGGERRQGLKWRKGKRIEPIAACGSDSCNLDIANGSGSLSGWPSGEATGHGDTVIPTGGSGDLDDAERIGFTPGRQADAADDRAIAGSAIPTIAAGVGLGNPGSTGLPNGEPQDLPRKGRKRKGRATQQPGQARPGPTNGFWDGASLVWCLPEPRYPEGSWRPVEPGTFPLAHGATNRVVKLRGYGDGIVAQQASAFITAFMEEATK